ncbi:MAG TPA: hypothetical protein VGE47_12725, partial [Burkholderiaceae bacterium]
SARPSVEFAVANAAGTLPSVASVSTDGLGDRQIRRGKKCTLVHESRIAQLNPMDDRLKGMPAAVGSCN